MSEIEVNVVIDENEVIVLKSAVVPREGDLMSIRGKDYIVTLVAWALDYTDMDFHYRKFRVTIGVTTKEPTP